MLKHLPEGLVPFEDCGFSRKPCVPLEGQNVAVECRADHEDGIPSLLWSVNDGMIQTAEAVQISERFFRFELGAFSFGERVSYQIVSSAEKSRWFEFEVQREECCSAPKQLRRSGDTFYAVFDGFSVSFRLENTLEIIAALGERTEGEECEQLFFEASSLSLNLQKSIPFCELKRLSSSLVSIDSYTVRRTASGKITQIRQYGSLPSKYVWGTGERFDQVNQRSGASNGRVVEKFTRQGDQTYLPIPFFMTDTGMGWYRDSRIPAQMDFQNGLMIAQETQGEGLSRDLLFFGQPGEVLAQFLSCTGAPVLPPEWAFGVWISANGWNCDAEVDAQLEALEKYDYPADVMVLEAWSDERTFYRWNDNKHWKDPAALVRRVRDHGLHLILWQIPIIKHEWDGEPGHMLENDVREAIEKGYCVLNADGTPYRITENWFHHSLLLDFTNPEALRWWFEKRRPLLEMGVEGFKTDGGEFLFDQTARLSNGMTGLEAHNAYPGQYIGAYHDFMRANGVSPLTFSRAGYLGAQTQPMHWAGDQLSLWTELEAQLKAGISAGLSGILFWGFDIGGFAGELPAAELYLRATAMGCFSPVMQWHAEPRYGQFYATHGENFNNDRSPWNLAEKLNDEQVLRISVQFARLRHSIKQVLWEEAVYCAEHGRPMMAHMCIDYPEDERAAACEDQYMLGRRWLVAPVVKEGTFEREVYLPCGRWKHFFSGEIFEGKQTICVRCPLDEIPVFERQVENI